MDSYDFVIVGGGTAGCVLAARLSGNPHVSVLLLEAGAAQSPAGAEVPPAWPALLQSPANWGDVAAGQTAARRPVAMARARVLGGGSAINAMVFVRGIRTGLQRYQQENITPEIQAIFDSYPWRTVEQGAATSVLLAASPLVEGVTGRYFEDCNEAEVTTDPDAENGVRPHALDPEDAARLWDVSVSMLNA